MDYDEKRVEIFDDLIETRGYPWKLRQILPKVRKAGEKAGVLTEEGAKLLDPTGELEAGIPLCPPEGDAGTGMTATNSVREGTQCVCRNFRFCHGGIKRGVKGQFMKNWIL